MATTITIIIIITYQTTIIHTRSTDLVTIILHAAVIYAAEGAFV